MFRIHRGVAAGVAIAVMASTLVTSYAASAADSSPRAAQPRAGEPATVYAVIKTITLAPSNTEPYAIAVDPTDDTVYVANYTGGKVSVINGRTGTWDDTVTVGSNPIGVAVNDADDSVYVTNTSGSSVSVFNGRTLSPVSLVTGLIQPKGVAVDQNDDTVYVPTIAGADLAYFNGATPGTVSRLSLGGQPTGVAVNNSDDTVYVTNIGGVTDAVWVVNGRTGSLDDTVNVGSNPFWVAVDQSDDTVYTSNATGNSVTVIKGSNRTVTGTISLGAGANPEGVAVNPGDHKVFVAKGGATSPYGTSVSVIDGITGTLTDDTITVGVRPSGVAVDGSGAFNAGLVYVANRNTGGPGSVSVIGKATPTVPVGSSGTAGSSVVLTVSVPNLAPGYVMDASTVTSVLFNGVPGTVVGQVAGTNAWTVTAPAGPAGQAVPVTVNLKGARTASAGTFTYDNPVPPPAPPGPPNNVKAQPGYQSATVTWEPPTSSGSSAVTYYRVTSQPGGKTCLVAAPSGGQGGDGGDGGVGGAGSVRPRAAAPLFSYANIKTIPVGSRPRGIAVDETDDKVYVSNWGSIDLSVINGATGAEDGRIAINDPLFPPTGLAIDEVDDSLYVVSARSAGGAGEPPPSKVLAFNTNTRQKSGEAETKEMAVAVAVDLRDDRIFAPGTIPGRAGVSVVDGRTMTPSLPPISVRRAIGAAVHQASQTVWVSSAGRATAINARTKEILGEVSLGMENSAVAVLQSSNTVYVASPSSNDVSVIDGATRTLTSAIPVGDSPYGVAVDQRSGSGNSLFVTNSGSNNVTVIDRVAGQVAATVGVGVTPWEVAVDSTGTNAGLAYVTNYSSNTVSVIGRVSASLAPSTGTSGATTTLTLDVANLAAGFAIDPDLVTSVTFNGVPGTGLRKGSGNTWTTTVPNGRPGSTVAVTVGLKGGSQVSAGNFTYLTPSTAISCVIEGLSGGTEYTFTVEALNGGGWGAPSAPSNPVTPYGPAKATFTTPGLYECTVNGTGTKTIPFTVKGGKGGAGNQGVIDDAAAIPNPGGFGASVGGSFDVAGGTKLYLTVGENGLDAGSFDDSNSAAGGGGGYSAISLGKDKDPIVVAGGGGGGSYFNPRPASGSGGDGGDPGSVSPQSSRATPLPTAPTITAAWPNDGEARIVFTPPVNAEAAQVSTYEFQVDGGAWVRVSPPPGPANYFVIPGLTNGQRYSVAIRAVGGAGVGPASATVQVTPGAMPYGGRGGNADPRVTTSGGGNGGDTAFAGAAGGTRGTPGKGGQALTFAPNPGGPGGDGGAPGVNGANATDDSGGAGGGGGGGFGASGGMGSAEGEQESSWSALPGAYGGGGGGAYDGGGGGGGYAGGGGGAGGYGNRGAGGGGGGSSLLVSASTAPGITNKVDGTLASDSTAPSVSIENVMCSFAVTYQGNGNTAGTVPTDPVWYTPGSSATVLEGTGLKRDTEVFAGWSSTQFGPVAYSPGATISPINGPVTLWAVYATAKTVTFDANLGTGEMAPQSSATPEALEKNTFERTDYAFVDWNTKADGSGTSYANEATYSFTADVKLFAQWKEAKEPESEPVPPLEPGDSQVKEGGQVAPVIPEPTPMDNGVVFVDGNWTMTLQGLGADGSPLPLNTDGVLVLQSERDARSAGTGFLPNSLIGLFLDPPVEDTAVRGRALPTVDLGTLPVGQDGNFDGVKTLPEEIAPGPHVLQAVGYGPAGERRVVSLGVLVRPWITLDQGTRVRAGYNDRIRTGGDTGGIAPGTRLTPYIKYTGQERFKKGRATIVVKADGTYKWTRKIRKNRGVTAYVRWTDVRSNTVFWAKLT